MPLSMHMARRERKDEQGESGVVLYAEATWYFNMLSGVTNIVLLTRSIFLWKLEIVYLFVLCSKDLRALKSKGRRYNCK